jgi:hypothetical protein
MNSLIANKKQKEYAVKNKKRIDLSNNILIDLFKVSCFLQGTLKGRDLTKRQKKALKFFGFLEYDNSTVEENIQQFVNSQTVVIGKKYRYDLYQCYTEVVITIFNVVYYTDWYNNSYTIIFNIGYEGYFSQYQYWLGDILDKKIKN